MTQFFQRIKREREGWLAKGDAKRESQAINLLMQKQGAGARVIVFLGSTKTLQHITVIITAPFSFKLLGVEALQSLPLFLGSGALMQVGTLNGASSFLGTEGNYRDKF